MAKVTRVEGKKGVSYRIDYFDPKGKRIRKMFKKKKDAEAELGKRVSLMAEGRYLDVKKDVKITLHELIERFAQAYANQAYFMSSKHIFLRNFEDFIGRDTLVSQIGWDKITEYVSYLENKRTARKRTAGIRRPSNVNREISAVRHLFSEAAQWELIERSPFEGKRKVLKKEPDHRLRWLTEDEITKLLGECDHKPWLRRIVAFALNTGYDKGDIFNLRWEDIREDEIVVKRGKTGVIVRTPINGEIDGILKDIRAVDGLKYDHVFTRNGKPVKVIDKPYNAALRRAGLRSPDLERNVDFKTLRHTFASHLMKRGRHLVEIKELMGHKKIETTMRYSHLAPNKRREAIESLEGITDYVKSDMSENVRKTGKNR